MAGMRRDPNDCEAPGKRGGCPVGMPIKTRAGSHPAAVGSRPGLALCGQHQERFKTLACCRGNWRKGYAMNGLIYLVGLVVVILAILSFFGLR